MKEKTSTNTRSTKYCSAIEKLIAELGHATNIDLLDRLRETYPNLSATTVHRATARLARRGVIGLAPSDLHGAMRYDQNTNEHDHFMCDNCGLLKDAQLKDLVVPIVEGQLEGCHIAGRIVISGRCDKCQEKERVR
ncbi:transcriptional repressor [Candidatus Saccharibacteria bacterium]|nr:transcriptional repressor [Candidatus Saccharibacteria bacterium]